MKINFNNNIKGDKFFVNKVVVFIVEGGTDKRALENIFKKIYKYKQIHFEFTHGDITSDENINKSNIEIEIYKHVNSYLKDKKLKLLYQEAVNKIRADYTVGEAKTGDLSGVYGYDIYYNKTNYELAYTVEYKGDQVIVVIMAGTRENFYDQLKQYMRKM